MDSLTQIALGAVIGQAFGYKKLGKKALVMGGLAGFIPDLDVLITPVAALFGHHDDFMGWKYHRHFSHSLWFGPLLGSLTGWALWRHYGRQAGHFLPWVCVMILALLTHPLLDTCTIYGTQLLAPFSTHRFYISSVSIIDPIYSLPLFLCLLSCCCFSQTFRHSERIAQIILFLTTLYLGYGWYLNIKAEEIAKTQLAKQSISYERLNAYTTIFQPYLRRIVVWQNNDLLRVGFVSTFAPSHIYWTCRKQAPDDIKKSFLKSNEGKTLMWFALSTVNITQENNGKTILASDARYGVPGESLFGWWGMEFVQNHDGSLKYVGRTHAKRDVSWANIEELLKASYGFDNSFLPRQDNGC